MFCLNFGLDEYNQLGILRDNKTFKKIIFDKYPYKKKYLWILIFKTYILIN